MTTKITFTIDSDEIRSVAGTEGVADLTDTEVSSILEAIEISESISSEFLAIQEMEIRELIRTRKN